MRPTLRVLLAGFLVATVLHGTAIGAAGRAEPPAVQSAAALFQEAQHLQEVVGDLEGAIRLYERVVAEFPSQRSLAARALVQMGQCFDKLGRAEAQEAYERVLSDYADQTDMVTRAGALLAALRRRAAAEGSSTIVVRQMEMGLPATDVDSSGGPSPDGRYLSYVDWDSGDVALHDLLTGESRRLTTDGASSQAQQYPLDAAISPDGNLVAYSWWNGVSAIELRLVGLDGSGQRVLYSVPDIDVYPESWSSDGRYIAAARFGAANGGVEVVQVSTEDGEARSLRALTLSYSPDDRYVATDFPVEGDSRNFDIALLATDGSGDSTLIDNPASDKLLGFLPGTSELLFLSDRSGSWDVWAVGVADGKAEGAPRPVRRALGDVNAMGFTRDGSLFYNIFTRHFTTSIAPFDAATGQLQLSAGQPLLGSYYSPDWSPSGRYVAVVSEERGPVRGGFTLRARLRVRDLETGEDRLVASDLDINSPRWSPDGRSILVAGLDRTSEREDDPGAIYSIDVESDEAEVVVQLPGNRGVTPVWLRDGESIAYVHEGRLLLREISSGRETELYRDPDLAVQPLAVSPDGSQLAFAVAADSQPGRKWTIEQGGRLMMMPVSGGPIRQLAVIEEIGGIRHLVWSSDGQHVLFVQDRKGDSTLWRVPIEGGDLEKLWEVDVWFTGKFDLAPGGDRIVFTVYEQRRSNRLHGVRARDGDLGHGEPRRRAP